MDFFFLVFLGPTWFSCAPSSSSYSSLFLLCNAVCILHTQHTFFDLTFIHQLSKSGISVRCISKLTYCHRYISWKTEQKGTCFLIFLFSISSCLPHCSFLQPEEFQRCTTAKSVVGSVTCILLVLFFLPLSVYLT